MKKNGIILVLGIAGASLLGLERSALADFFSIAPNGTYLRAAASDSVVDPAIINLSTLTTPVHAGDTILIQRIGAVTFALNSGDIGTSTGAVFSATNTFLAKSNQNRVVDAIDAGIDFASPNTSSGNLPTDISQDFMIDDAIAGTNRHFSSAMVTVPAGAQFLFVGLLDNLFSDNADPNGDYGVSITVVPEPASLAMLGAGALMLLRRRACKS